MWGEIRLENDELILQKLSKLKCSQGCQNTANYIVFQMGKEEDIEGLYCTTCLAKLQEVPQSHLATLEDLSKIIADMTDNYRKSIKTGNNLLVLKAEAETQEKVIKNLRDGLTIDAKSISSKISQLSASAESHCLTENRNQPLQDFFEPDLTTSVLLNGSQLFVNNIKNLKVVVEGNKVSYEFKESQKNPQLAKQKALKQMEQIGNTLNHAQNKIKDIMGRFRAVAKKE